MNVFVICQYTGRMVKFVEHQKRQKTQLWTSIVTILLIDGTSLLSMDDNGFSDPYVKFRLANERYKSKVNTRFFLSCVNLAIADISIVNFYLL